MRPDYPACWPDTNIVKSVHTPFNWRRPGDSPEPLNAGIRKTTPKPTAGTSRQPTSFGVNNGTIPGLSKKAQAVIALKSFVTNVASHSGVYSKAVPK